MDKVEELLEAIKNDSSTIREQAAKELGELHDAQTVEPLIELIHDYINKVRFEAVKALGEIADKRAVEPLIKILENDFAEIRTEAAIALGNIGDSRAIEPLNEQITHYESVPTTIPRITYRRRGMLFCDPSYEWKVVSARSYLKSYAEEAIEKIRKKGVNFQ